MTYATYVVLSIMPAFTVFLAYVDMDLERAKQVVGSAVSMLANQKGPQAVAPAASALRPVQPMPKTVPAGQYSSVNNGQAPFASIAPYPTMATVSAPTQAYPPAPMRTAATGQGGVFGGLMNNMGRLV